MPNVRWILSELLEPLRCVAEEDEVGGGLSELCELNGGNYKILNEYKAKTDLNLPTNPSSEGPSRRGPLFGETEWA